MQQPNNAIAAPPRPTGVERNLVITLWDWGSPIDGRSDDVAGDTRIPTANANGPIYGVAEMTDSLTMLDPVTHRVRNIKVLTDAPPLVSSFNAAPTPSPFWGENMWRRAADVRSSAVDQNGKLWMAVRMREAQRQPSFCTSSSNKYAAYFPLSASARQVRSTTRTPTATSTSTPASAPTTTCSTQATTSTSA